MNTAQWILGVVLLTASGLIILLNWGLIIRTVLTKKHASGVPLVGALAGVLGLLIIPIDGVFARFWWIPPLIDYGFGFSILGAIYLSIFGSRNQPTK